MADEMKKRISDLPRATELDKDALLMASNPDSTTESGFTSKALPLEVLAETVLGDINFETELITPNKDIFGAINDAYNHGGGGGGSNVTMTDNPNGGVDLDVEGTTRTLAEQETLNNVVSLESNESVSTHQLAEMSDLENLINVLFRAQNAAETGGLEGNYDGLNYLFYASRAWATNRWKVFLRRGTYRIKFEDITDDVSVEISSYISGTVAPSGGAVTLTGSNKEAIISFDSDCSTTISIYVTTATAKYRIIKDFTFKRISE